jgi:hypothetical protein
MKQVLLLAGLSAAVPYAALHAQTSRAPYAPFTAKQAELGKELVAKSLEPVDHVAGLLLGHENVEVRGRADGHIAIVQD